MALEEICDLWRSHLVSMSYGCLVHERRTVFNSYMQSLNGICMKPGVGTRYILSILFITVIKYLTRQLNKERYFLANSSGTSVYPGGKDMATSDSTMAEAYGNCLLPVTNQKVRRKKTCDHAIKSQGPPQWLTSCNWAPLPTGSATSPNNATCWHPSVQTHACGGQLLFKA